MLRKAASLLLLAAWLAGVASPAHAQSTASCQEHLVQSGDTLLAIALRYNTSVRALQAANNLSNPDLLRVGQRLCVPIAAPAASTVHVVQAGDTLLALALRYGVSLDALVRVNNLSDPNRLAVGQRLLIPVENNATAPSQPAALPAVPAASVVPSSASSADIEAMRRALLELYNQARQANGLAPLSYSPVLESAAQAHAEDCARRGACSHIGSDGSRSSQRIARAGYAGRFTGENWVWARTPEQAFTWWYHREMPDGPHLRNILSPHYREVGFGIAPAYGGAFYFIANFGG